MIHRRTFLLSLAALPLAGCGFSLRGVGEPRGTLPESIRIQTTDPFAPFIRDVTRQLKDQGAQVVESGAAVILNLSLPVTTERELGPLDSNRDQMELVMEVTYTLTGADLVEIIPTTTVRASVIYVDSGVDNSAEDQRINQLKRSLTDDLLRQIVPSIRVRYEQALKQAASPGNE
jgi:outer membrane lipopolysaccharide assembly protein LptE/RlpB